jgi:hypothetical protein
MQAVPYILRGVILPLVIGGILAYLYPSLRAYFKNPSSFRRSKIDRILEEYRTVQRSAGDRSFLIMHLVFHLASLLGQLAVLILVSAINLSSLLGDFLGLILYGYLATSCLVQVNKIQSLISNSAAFNIYREKTTGELIRLGGSSEGLDKEEAQK